MPPPDTLVVRPAATPHSEGTSLEEQVRRIKDIEAIESDSFVPQAFKSSRDDIKVEPAEVKQEDPSEAPVEVAVLPTSIRYNDTDNLAHPSVSALPPDTRVHANTPVP
ncbi:unnamed protein product [Boreogadus saida]